MERGRGGGRRGQGGWALGAVPGRELEVGPGGGMGGGGVSVWLLSARLRGPVVPVSALASVCQLPPTPGPSGPRFLAAKKWGGRSASLSIGVGVGAGGQFLNTLEASTRGLCAPLRPVVSGALEPAAEVGDASDALRAEPPPQSPHPLGRGHPEEADGCLGGHLC